MRLLPPAQTPTAPARGTWFRWGGLYVRCPECGQIGSLSDHTIAADGIVTPSVQCPTEGCAWHEFVQLDEYSGIIRRTGP